MKQRFWLARVTVQAASPLAIGSGQSPDLFDMAFVAGHGGLPYLPGTSLAGVLRRRFERMDADRDITALFGRIDKDAETAAAASRLHISAGLIHGADDLPRAIDHTAADEVLALSAQGITRDHVRRDGFGVADGRGKFDVTAVPIGARFTFELRLDASDDAQAEDDDAIVVPQLLRALTGLRLGSKTRAGYGRVTLVRACTRRFDLGETADLAAFVDLPRDLCKPAATSGLRLHKTEPSRDAAGQPVNGGSSFTVPLQARDHWLIGGGEVIDGVGAHKNQQGRPRHGLPWSERRITWTSGRQRDRGSVDHTPVPVLPGSSVKGALRHRTLYHLRREAGPGSHRDADAAVAGLFGQVKQSQPNARGGEGHAGRVHVDDAVLEPAAWDRSGAFDHVSLDRFTGGAMPGLLYSEATLFRSELPLSVEVEPPRPGADPEQDAALRRALAWAVADLCAGRLPLGAKANAGHGTFLATDPEAVRSAISGLLVGGGRSL